MLSTICNDSRRHWWCLLLSVVVWGTVACQSERKIGSHELETFDQLLSTGATFDGDPYVRAETLRVLEELEAPTLTSTYARPRLDDTSPMVRTAALRAIVATDVGDVERIATRQYNQSDGAERRAILDVVLEHGSRDLQLDLLARALRSKEGGESEASGELRRFAFRQGLEPLVERALEEGRGESVRDLFAPRIHRYVRRMDPVLGGLALKLLIELGETDRARPLVDTLKDDEAPLDQRLRAARILTEARAESARPVFRRIVEEARVDPDESGLALPEPRVDDRLVRASVLGLVAIGESAYLSRAKSYLEGADADAYIEVLEALADHPSEKAALSLKTAMLDARPRVRHRAIELYGPREESNVEDFLDVLRNEQFERQMKTTRRTIARVLVEHFPEAKAWVLRLSNHLTSEEGIRPALKLLQYVSHRTDVSKTLALLRADLLKIVRDKKDRRASLAAHLLVELADDGEIETLLRNFDRPLPRYAYLEHVLEDEPAAHVEFLRDNLYPETFALDLFAIRLMSGAALWRAHRDMYGSADGKGRRDGGASQGGAAPDGV